MQTEIAVKIREIYGKPTFYPVNIQAARLAALVGTKTLTIETLIKAKAMGFDLVRVDAYGSAPLDLNGEAANDFHSQVRVHSFGAQS